MHRLTGLILVHALVVSWIMAPSQHVHDYADHDHPDHHHGPAAHGHEHPSVVHLADDSSTGHDRGQSIQAGSCDPGRHVTAVTSACARLASVQMDVAGPPGHSIFFTVTSIRSVWPVADVRAHGPPLRGRLPSRAPPLTFLA